jgi:hypothetical protein
MDFGKGTMDVALAGVLAKAVIILNVVCNQRTDALQALLSPRNVCACCAPDCRRRSKATSFFCEQHHEAAVASSVTMRDAVTQFYMPKLHAKPLSGMLR